MYGVDDKAGYSWGVLMIDPREKETPEGGPGLEQDKAFIYGVSKAGEYEQGYNVLQTVRIKQRPCVMLMARIPRESIPGTSRTNLNWIQENTT